MCLEVSPEGLRLRQEVSLGLKDRSMVDLSTGLKRCGESLKILEEKILQQILRREVFAKLKLLLRM